MNIWVFEYSYLKDRGISLHYTKGEAEQARMDHIMELWHVNWPDDSWENFEEPVEEYGDRLDIDEFIGVYEMPIEGHAPLEENECIINPDEQDLLLHILANTPNGVLHSYSIRTRFTDRDASRSLNRLYKKFKD